MPEFNLKLLQDIHGALVEVKPLVDVGDASHSSSIGKENQ